MKPSEKTFKLFEVIKSKEELIYGYTSKQIERDFESLIKGNRTEVGYRAGCGKVDRTHKVFKEWIKLLKSLKKDGFIIIEENVIHPNKSPTMANGFWNSIIYYIKISDN